ncbi:MAG: hypothetical protein FJ221_14325 [Lentisphaerae bacterium]|nr:hypothetical protein [Lentisphaerota bacterium]
MPFEQTRDVIDKARAFHHDMASFYHRVEHVVEKERVRMVLDWLASHEERMEGKLAEVEASTAKRVLDSWYQYPPDATVQDAVARIEIRPDMRAQDVICMALHLDENLLRLYKRAAEAAPMGEVREVFESLLEEGKREREKLVLDLFEPEL